ncbi:MAG: hypothetical protein U5M51_00060 [Emticicia sp.]|nr:hypothetical protein [Emticicia sp.]
MNYIKKPRIVAFGFFMFYLGLTQSFKNWWLSEGEAPILGVSAASATVGRCRPIRSTT